MVDKRVQQKQPVPFRDMVLMMICEMRHYDRNQSFYGSVFLLGLGYLFAIAAVWFYRECYLIPEAIFLAIFMIAMLAWMPVKYANVMKWGACFNIILGVVGLLRHWEFGLSVFGTHLENLAFASLVIGGVLGIARRFWNAFIWHQQDRLAHQYGFSKART